MKHWARRAVLGLVSGAAVLLAACGGGSSGGGGGGGGGNPPVLPTVTVTPAANSIATSQALQVTVTVTGTSGSATPTGTIVLSSGSYASAAATLSRGSATISVPAGKLTAGSNTLTASYTPDAASSSTYKGSTGTALVAITVSTPTVTVMPASPAIASGQPLSVTVAVTGFSGGPVPSGSVTLTSPGYSSAATALDNTGSATITVPPGSLTAGSPRLTATYSPDTAGSATYASGSGSATVNVTFLPAPVVTVSPAAQSLSTAQSLGVTVKVSGANGGATPTGSVVLSSGNYQSSATTLTSGSASIIIPAYSLVHGSDTLITAYTPDAQSSVIYNTAIGSATVSVARATPTVTVTPASTSINTSQTLNVTVAVTGPGTGAPAPTGTVNLSSGSYSSTATLTSGSATIIIAAGALAAGIDTLTAAYTPDSASSPFFSSASGTSAAITVVLLSTVTVNESTTLAPVTDQLMGMNLATWYDVDSNASAIKTAFSAAGIKAIRWPGGSWSDTYHWGWNQTNLAPFTCNTNNTPATPNGWGGWATFPQFVTSIAKAGSYDLALTANYGSNENCTGGGDPAEAAAWAAEAVTEGYPASHMTVGNENYGSWEYDLHPKRWDAATYANSVVGNNGYYKLIKTASPTTSVGVVVDAGNIQPAWDSTVLSAAKGSYDFVEYHYYPQNPPGENDTYLVHQAAPDFTTSINKLKSELTTAGVAGTPIYVGEMGSVPSNPGKQSWSITQGLYAGQMLGEMMNDGISRATWWIGFGNCNGNAGNFGSSLYGWQTVGAYNVFSDGSTDSNPACPGLGPIGTMSPTAQAYDLFQNLAVTGESALSTAFAGDATNIRAYAATHSGGTALFLFNLNQTESRLVQITLSKTPNGTSSDVTVITYDKALYDKSNPANQSGIQWPGPTTTDMGVQDLPLTLTLTPWSMNVVIIKH